MIQKKHDAEKERYWHRVIGEAAHYARDVGESQARYITGPTLAMDALENATTAPFESRAPRQPASCSVH